MFEPLFSWIHLSDIHVGHGDAAHRWDLRLVLSSLRDDIARVLADGMSRPDAIFVTGDIAFSGNGRSPDEYGRARALLIEIASAVGVPSERIFLVPGNHDVDRRADKDPATRQIIERIRRGDLSVDEVLSDPYDRGRLGRRFDAYLRFAELFAPVTKGVAWCSALAARDGLRVRLVGLNTALVAAGDDDRGKLRLGNEQTAAVLEAPPKEGELFIVLGHHPLHEGWLADEGEARRWVRQRAHLYLFGHVHEAASEHYRAGSGADFIQIAAGAVHEERRPDGMPNRHGYGFGQVVRGTGGALNLRVHPRVWSERKKAFRPDVDNTPDRREYAEHALRIALPAKPTPRHDRGGAVRVYIAYAAEDDALRKSLEAHLASLRHRGLIRIERSRMAEPGANARSTAESAIEAAEIVLLLLSPSFLASDGIFDLELPAIHRRFEAGAARVVPILLRPVDTVSPYIPDESRKQWYERLAVLPRDEVPVTSASNQDEAFTEIARDLRALIDRQRGA